MTAEEKVANIIIKKINKKIKNVSTKKKAPPKKNNCKLKKNSVMDNVENNDYLKIEKKPGRNKQVFS